MANPGKKRDYKEVPAIENENGGLKNDIGKLDYTLLPWNVLEKLAVRYTAGAKKYSAWNWTKIERERYEAAMFRHWVEYKKGNRYDDDPAFEGTGSTHLQSFLWNAVALVYFELQDIENEKTNNTDKKEK